MTGESIFDALAEGRQDPIFAVALLAKKAPSPKADLIIGAYRDAEGRPYPLNVVRKAERLLLEMNLDKEYLPMRGFGAFIDEAVKLAYGDSISLDRVAAAQGLSGTGSLSLGAFFLSQLIPTDTPVYISNPTWPNHYAVMHAAGFRNTKPYRYYNPGSRSLDIDGLLEDLRSAPAKSVIILHACAHNPTGVDPTREQWREIAEVVKTQQLIPFFDSAYQGYATGSLDDDAYVIRYFAKQGMEMLLAQSFSKNMGLYAERAGVFSVLTNGTNGTVAKINGCLENIARMFYSSPPGHGARVAHLILSTPELRKEWAEELRSMSKRVQDMRQATLNGLIKCKTPGKWEHVVSQVGMFSYLGLSEAQCLRLREKNVFVLPTGRANMASLTESSVELLVNAIDDAVRNVK